MLEMINVYTCMQFSTLALCANTSTAKQNRMRRHAILANLVFLQEGVSVEAEASVCKVLI